MNRKSVAVKLALGADVESIGTLDASKSPDNSEAPKSNEHETEKAGSETDFDVLQFSTDATGNTVLLDGTPVVQPAGVEDTQGCTVQFDLQDGTLPRRSSAITNSQFGNMDSVRCTSCAVRLSPFACAIHPHLRVLICKVIWFGVD